MTREQDRENALAHFGVPGMRWGRRSASAPNTSAPSMGKLLGLGMYGKKTQFKNKEALAKRTSAGKLRTAALIQVGAGLAVKGLSNATQNKGISILGDLLMGSGGITASVSSVKAIDAVATENRSRNG